jgi:hypothetical protein
MENRREEEIGRTEEGIRRAVGERKEERQGKRDRKGAGE